MANVCVDSELLNKKNELSSQDFEKFPLQRTDVLLSPDHRNESLNYDCNKLTSWSSPSNNSDLCIARSEFTTSNDAQTFQQVPSENYLLSFHAPPPLELNRHNTGASETPKDHVLTTGRPQPADQSLTTGGPQSEDQNLITIDHNVTTKEPQHLESVDRILINESHALEPNNYIVTTSKMLLLEPKDFSLSNEKGIHDLASSEPQASEAVNLNLTSNEPQASKAENPNLASCIPQASEAENITHSEPHQEGHISLKCELLPQQLKNGTFPSDSHSLESDSKNCCIKSEYSILGSENHCAIPQVQPSFKPEHRGLSAIQSNPLSLKDCKSQINTNNFIFPLGKLPQLRILLKKCDAPKDSAYNHESSSKNKGDFGSAAGHEKAAMNVLMPNVEVFKLKDTPLLPVKRKVGRPRKCFTEKLGSPKKAEAVGGNKVQNKFNYQFKLRETDLKKIKERIQFYDEFNLRDSDVILECPSKASNLSTRKRSDSEKGHVVGRNTINKKVKAINNDDRIKNVKFKKIGRRRHRKRKIDACKNVTVKENCLDVGKAKCHFNDKNRGSEPCPEYVTTNSAKQVPGKKRRGRPPKKGLKCIENGSKSSLGQVSTSDQVSDHSLADKKKSKCHSEEKKEKLHITVECAPKRKLSILVNEDVDVKKPKLTRKPTLLKLKKTNKINKLHGKHTFKTKFNLRSFGEGKKLRSKSVLNDTSPVKKNGKVVSKKKVNSKEGERCESPISNPTSPIVEMDHDAEVDFETLFPLGMENSNRGVTPRKLTDQPKKSFIEKPPSETPYPLSLIYYKTVGKACDLSHACCHKCAQTKVDISTQWEDPTDMFAAIDAAIASAQISTQFIPHIKKYAVAESTQYQQQAYQNPPLKVQEMQPNLHQQPSQTSQFIQSDAVSPALQPNPLSTTTSHSYSQQSPLNDSYETLLQKFISQTQQQVQNVSQTVLNRISQTLQVNQVSQVLQADTTSYQPNSNTSQILGSTSAMYHNLPMPNFGGVSSSTQIFFSKNNNKNVQVPLCQMGQLTNLQQLTPFLLVPMTVQNLQGLSGHQTKTIKRGGKQHQMDTNHLQSQMQMPAEGRVSNKGSKSSPKPRAGKGTPPVIKCDAVLIGSRSEPSADIGDPRMSRCDVVLGGGRADSNSDQDGFIGLELDVSCVDENSVDSFKNDETTVQNNDNSSESVDGTDYIYIE